MRVMSKTKKYKMGMIQAMLCYAMQDKSEKNAKRKKKGSKTGIDLSDNIMIGIISPIPTRLGHNPGDLPLGDFLGVFHNVDVQAGADVPSDMAMEGPHARVVGIELDDHVSGALDLVAVLQHLHVATGRVLLDGVTVPFALALGQDPEVVPVHVHGVRGPIHVDQVADVETDRGVGAEVVDVPLWIIGVGCVAAVGEEEEGITVRLINFGFWKMRGKRLTRNWHGRKHCSCTIPSCRSYLDQS